MKKRSFALYSLVVVSIVFSNPKLQAQNGSIGIGTASPDASAILDITSTTQGVLLPRLTQDQRNAIVSPAPGLLIYQTDFMRGFYYYLGGWQPLTASSSSAANKSLSNLQGPTAVNTDLLPLSSASFDLGSSSLSWKDFYFFGDVYLQGNRFISSRGTNSFFGNEAGNSAITALYTTAIGYNALTNNITGNWNTANGYQALLNTNSGNGNTAVGFHSLVTNSTGAFNTAVGVSALFNTISGTHNSALGLSSGENLSSGNYNTFLGALANVPFGFSVSNATAIGYQAEVTSSNSIKAGNTSVTSIGGYAGWTTFPSDGRFKRNVKENVPGLQFINQLRAVTYNVDVDAINKALHPNNEAKTKPDAIGNKHQLTSEEIKSKQEKASITYTGFIAQEVEQAAKNSGFNFSGIDAPKNNRDLYGLRYAEFVVPIVKAVQELHKKIENAETENRLLKKDKKDTAATVMKQQAQIDKQQQQIDSLKALMLQMQKEMAELKTAAGNK